MKLRHITFTGVDEHTDFHRLEQIQQRFPYAEFGILFSKKWKENGQRYPSPAYLQFLYNRNLNLSAHICGTMARNVVVNNEWYPFFQLINYNKHLFNRVQLNIADYKFTSMQTTPLNVPSGIKELIIQQKSTYEIDVYKAMTNKRNYVSILFDASDDQGQLPSYCDLNLNPYIKAGYAGGINPENICNLLHYLFNNVNHPFWIDAVRGFRTRDWFDLDKVEQALECIDPIIKDYEYRYE